MKVICFFLFSLFTPLFVNSQTYVGTMDVDGYVRNDVKVRLYGKSPKGAAHLDMYSVKFARMMPVKVNLCITPLSFDGKNFSGDNIVPLSNGEKYDKQIIRKLSGTADSRQIVFSCMMGDKKMTYKGKRMANAESHQSKN